MNNHKLLCIFKEIIEKDNIILVQDYYNENSIIPFYIDKDFIFKDIKFNHTYMIDFKIETKKTINNGIIEYDIILKLTDYNIIYSFYNNEEDFI